MIITDEQARSHLRIDSDEDISIYVRAAEQWAAEFLNRSIYATEAEMEDSILIDAAGDNPLVANDLVRAAILLILGHLYANREEVVVGTSVTQIPMASQHLLQPYRVCMGV